MPIDNLEGKVGIMQILLYLHKTTKQEATSISDLQRNVKASRETILADVEVLKALNLAEDSEKKAFPFSHIVWLTEKGHAVAKQLEEVNRVLGHPKPLKESENV